MSNNNDILCSFKKNRQSNHVQFDNHQLEKHDTNVCRVATRLSSFGFATILMNLIAKAIMTNATLRSSTQNNVYKKQFSKVQKELFSLNTICLYLIK